MHLRVSSKLAGRMCVLGPHLLLCSDLLWQPHSLAYQAPCVSQLAPHGSGRAARDPRVTCPLLSFTQD